ncbi:hypothetical protein QWY90_11170 [Flavobacterium paronense]|uniref:tRNA_anti-like n=1 Tax=Flavobacterium paronense TaxID=1392775 RepID=A0ABV5GCA9_9FLAO|nr:hypothetical protein [Flavobacterium paronense]MDN3677869.1 hypothetical protein [Flavobacterium paronense]
MLKKVFTISGIVIIVLLASFFSVRYYINNGGKRDIASEDIAYKVPSSQIVAEFTSNATASNKKYLEKPVAVSGIVTSVNDKEVIIDNSVNCNLTKANNSFKNGQKVTVKGRVIGYDDLLGEVKLDQCNLCAN